MTEVDLTIAGSPQREPSGIRLVATLGLAGMLSGLALAGAYQVTKPTIDANKARARREAVFEVVPGAVAMHEFVLTDGGFVPAGEAGDGAGPSAFAAYDEGDGFLGWALEGEGAGYQDSIRVLCGYDPAARRVIGMYILESRETPGLGDKIFKDEEFVANFAALAVDPEVVVTKDGRSAPNEVDAITGATISSRAVVKIINGVVAEWASKLPPAGEEPPLPINNSNGAAPAEAGEG